MAEILVTPTDTDIVVSVGENTTLALQAAASAAASAAAAEAIARPIYASNAAGLAATSEGDFFFVNQGDGTADLFRHDAGPTATAMGRSVLIDPLAFTGNFTFHPKSNGDNAVFANTDYNLIATDVSASVIAGGGRIGSPNLIGFVDFYTEIAGNGSNNTFTSTFDATNPALIGVFLIRADGVRVQVEAFSDITIVGNKAQVVYPRSGNNTNNATGGAQGSDPFVLATEKIVILSREIVLNPGSGADLSGIFGSYDNVIQQGVMQHIVSHAHGRITGGDHNFIAGGSYHRKTGGSYGALIGGTGVTYAASGTGGGTLGAALSTFTGTGPQWGFGTNLVMSGAFSGAGGTTNTVSGNGAWAFGRNITASGRDVFAGGFNTNVSGVYAAGFGLDNVVSGAHSIAQGRSVTVSGESSAGFGRNVTVSAPHALAHGRDALATFAFSQVVGGEQFAAQGDCQTIRLVLKRTTTNGSATDMRIGNATSRMDMPANTTWAFEGLIVGRRVDSGTESAGYRIAGCIRRGATAGATALVGSPTITVLGEDTAAWDVTILADMSNGGLIIRVTGEADKTIRWVGSLSIAQVSG